MKKYVSFDEILMQSEQGIHIECSQQIAQKISMHIREYFKGSYVSYVLEQDEGYERKSVCDYLKFFYEISDKYISYKVAIEKFLLSDIGKKKIKDCTYQEKKMVQMARASLFSAEIYYFQDPITNLDFEETKAILSWFEELFDSGCRIITTSRSLRFTLLLSELGRCSVFHQEGQAFIKNTEIAEELETASQHYSQKIVAKSDKTTLFFEPHDIDYIESICKVNYIFVHGTSYQTDMILDELEKTLKKYGFFRCHRSYIVNLAKIEKIEKFTKNSYGILLNNEGGSQLPLSKARVSEIKKVLNY